MVEYIKKEKAIKLLTDSMDAYGKFSVERSIYMTARQKIKNIPAADVAPIMRGEWENGNPICPVCGQNKFKGLDADIWADWQPPCCPQCGAKMDGEK